MLKNNIPPMRRCVGCMESKPKQELIRIAFYEGMLTLDLKGDAKGRGAYICNSGECFDEAVKRKAFGRTLKAEISLEDLERIRREIDDERQG